MSHKHAIALAQAALMDIISRGQAIQAATMRDAGSSELEALRTQAHDALDGYLDRMGDAATAVRTLLKE